VVSLPGSHPERRGSLLALFLGLLAVSSTPARAQAEKPTIGRLIGEELVVLDAAGETFIGPGDSKIVTSGSQIEVRSGEARLELGHGGAVRICSRAHLTTLGSGNQVTLAIDSGRIEAAPSDRTRLSIYTAEIVAHPIQVAGEPTEFTLGVEAGGAICVRAGSGAVELEEQLTGKKLVVPQGGEMTLPEGRLASMREAPGGCRCKVELAGRSEESGEPPQLPVQAATDQPGPIAPVAPAAQPARSEAAGSATPPKVHVEASPQAVAPTERGALPRPPELSSPIWKVTMPPLAFNANEPSPPPKPSLEIVQLVREARVQPALMIRGKVMPGAPQKERGFWAKLGGFFGHLFGRRGQSHG